MDGREWMVRGLRIVQYAESEKWKSGSNGEVELYEYHMGFC
jgi:hypothetical protein